MNEQQFQQPTLETFNDFSGLREPLINASLLTTSLGILSVQDGIVVYANDAFRGVLKNTRTGEVINGFLDTEKARSIVSRKIEKYGRYTKVFNKSKESLQFTITEGQYSGSAHYYVCIESIKNESNEKEKNYLDRDAFLKVLSELVVQDESNQKNCLCGIDIDRFNVVNEKYGYEAGDFVLAELVNLIRECTSSEVIIGRLGSNEFGLILKNKHLDDAVQVCESIRETIKEIGFKWEDDSIAVTTSIGVIALKNQEESIEPTLVASNLALRSAQENGRDCVHSSATQDTMMAYHSGKMRYALVIEDALQNNKFELFVQPVVSLADANEHYYYEVLLRIYDANKKEFVSSQELISAAESLEVTTRIDQWVCERVFQTLSKKSDANASIPNVSINLSGHSIVSASFEKFLIDLTEEYSVPADHICFEITESVAVKSISRAQKFIKNMKAVGFKFALDDFGVGYCSFNYLQQLDVDNVKIDGSFVSAMLDDATQFATVQAITNVARTMDIKTIAEFVEKPEIIKALKVIGVDYGQGYIFGKPSPMKDLFLI